MKYRKKPVVVEAITFAELVEHGKANGANIVNGMPWSWNYAGHPITHENDECYLIPTLEGTMKMTPGDMLITGVKGEIYPCKWDIFAATYESAEKPAPDPCLGCIHVTQGPCLLYATGKCTKKPAPDAKTDGEGRKP